MSDMFYNYEHNSYCGCHTCHNIKLNTPKILDGWSGYEIIYDEKGNEIGMGYNRHSPITLVFDINGCIIDDAYEHLDIDEFINSNDIKFELLNFRHEPIFETCFNGGVCKHILKLRLGQHIVEKLEPEIYYIRLTLTTEYGDYVLFSPHDGLIHIS